MAKREGFTLLELLIVIIIIGVLTTLAIPQYKEIVEKARARGEAIQIMGMLRKAQEVYYATNGRYQQVNATNDPDDPLWKELGVDNPNAQLGTYFNYDFLYRPDFQRIYNVNGYAWVARPRNEYAADPSPRVSIYNHEARHR